MLALLSLSACGGDTANYPDEFVGFDKVSKSYTFDRQAENQEISVKIIAASKSREDRKAVLNIRWNPMKKPVAKLIDTEVVIPANKKSATARIRVLPKQIKQHETLHVICSPKDGKAKQSQLVLKLAVK